MKNMTLARMTEVCGGTYYGKKEDWNREICSVTTDSRKAEPGCLFAAIRGERVDGHDFIEDVFEKGALCVITEREPEFSSEAGNRQSSIDAMENSDVIPLKTEGNYIKVDSTIRALGALAAYYLEQLAIPVVGVTGSVGKTSTKEMIAAVLSQKYQTLKTEGNFNNELGLPLTIFRLRSLEDKETPSHSRSQLPLQSVQNASHWQAAPEAGRADDERNASHLAGADEIAVLEMGINHFGEMHRLAQIAKPDTCVITNIGQCHLEFLGDRDGVLRAKSEIFDFLRPDGHIILNGDDDKLAAVKEVAVKEGTSVIRPVFFGLGTENDIYADHIEKKGLDGIECRIHLPGESSFTVQIPIPGIHMVRNALAATAVGLHYGLTTDEIRAGIESLQPVSGRFHIIRTDQFTIIDDCYNANPMSMKASLEVLQESAPSHGRKVAILGDMGELGAEEEQMHRGVGEFAGGLDIDLCICVGPLSRHIAEGIQAAGRADNQKNASHLVGAEEAPPHICSAAGRANDERNASHLVGAVIHLEDLPTLLSQLPSLVQKGDTILVKASHFMHFEKVVKQLEEME